MSCTVFVLFHSAMKMLQPTPDMSFSSAEGVNKGHWQERHLAKACPLLLSSSEVQSQ